MTRGIKVEVGDGWSAIVLNLIVVGSRYSERSKFRFHRAWRNCGRMRIHVTTDSEDLGLSKRLSHSPRSHGTDLV